MKRMRGFPDITGKGGCVLAVSQSEQELVWTKLSIYDSCKPEIDPEFVGQQYIDIKDKKIYVSVGFTNKDRVLVGK